VRIRAATPADARAIGVIVADGLGEKVSPAFGDRAADAVAALVVRDLSRETIRYFVADVDSEVAGSARLAIGQQRGDGLGAIARAVGWRRAIRGAIVLGLLVHTRLADDEGYIEELAVRTDLRRGGIGRALLQACEETATAAGKLRVTLWVAAHNYAAVALYRSTGYRVTRRRRTLRGRWLFGAPTVLLMEKPLRRP
jgi:ribosomal protein S18 acetylase RimI-like enzyme